MEQKPLWQVFPNLVAAVQRDHIAMEATGGGHDFIHALMVAQYAKIISEEERLGILGWIAGLIHNTDRIFSKNIAKKINSYLQIPELHLNNAEKRDISTAVMKHSEPNKETDNPVAVVLKDADKLANIGPNIFIRSGQFYHDLPAFDPHWVEEPDPTSSYHNPKTVWRDILLSLEWRGKDRNGRDWIRTPKARQLSEKWFVMLESFLKGFASQLKEVELLPYPF